MGYKVKRNIKISNWFIKLFVICLLFLLYFRSKLIDRNSDHILNILQSYLLCRYKTYKTNRLPKKASPYLIPLLSNYFYVSLIDYRSFFCFYAKIVNTIFLYGKSFFFSLKSNCGFSDDWDSWF